MTTKEFKFTNGDKVKEKISGFEGIITGTAFYLTGCNQYVITAKPKDSHSEPQSIWYDEGRLELILPSKWKDEDVKAKDNGCDITPSSGKKGY